MKLYSINKAVNKTNNIIYNSPHSGELFPDGFLNTTSIDKDILLVSGDSFVNDLVSKVTENGSTTISNLYSRSFIDTNREAYELDPNMFSGNITIPLNHKSSKVQMGYGSIAQYAYNRQNIYNGKIPIAEAISRINDYYFPVHKALNNLLTEKFDQFGYSLLVDCHSMPSYEFMNRPRESVPQPDIILGDLHGKSCTPHITDYLTSFFKEYNLSVAHNAPFAGGYNTKQYGRPRKNMHSIQIEIKKSIYMNETKRKPNQNFETVQNMMTELSSQLNEKIASLIKK